MEYGRKANSGTADKVVRKLSLDPDETPRFFGTCSNWVPTLEWLLITNKRIFAGQSLPMSANWQATLSDITSVVPDGNAVGVNVASGKPVTLKKVPTEDHEVILGLLDGRAAGGATTAQTPEPGPVPSPTEPAIATPKASWSDRFKAAGEAAQAEWKDAVNGPLPKDHDMETHGELFKRAEIGLTTYEFYAMGFVRQAGGFRAAPIERIVSVKYRETTTSVAQDQSVVGSFLTNAISMGTMSTENVKRETTGSITVTTDSNIYTGDIKAKAGRMIEALGERVGRPQASTPDPQPIRRAAPDLADQIKKLAELHAAGIVTDDEFAIKKADLLNRM